MSTSLVLPDELQALASVVALVISLFSAWLGIRVSRSAKQADIQVEMHARFDRLQEVRTELLVRSKKGDATETDAYKVEVEIFFDRFWSLQYDQFIAWRQWLVPDHLYIMWTHARWTQVQDCLRDKAPQHWQLGSENIQQSALRVSERWRRTAKLEHLSTDYLADFLLLLDAFSCLDDFDDVQAILSDISPLRHPSRTLKFRSRRLPARLRVEIARATNALAAGRKHA